MDFEEIDRGLYSPKYQGVLTNQSKDHNSMRTGSVSGVFTHLPKVGKVLIFIGKPLTSAGNVRMIATSLVQSVDHQLPGQVVIFHTKNSTYRLDYSRLEK